jgi:D-arginine dehydrogenase
VVAATDFDAVVVGAGIAGASVAHFLAPQARVALVEREAQPGYHSTGRSAAVFAPSYGPPQVRALTRASRATLDAVPGVLSPRGSLFPARASQLDALHGLRELLVAEGTRGVAWLDTAAARAMVPVLRSQAVAAALHDAEASDIDVHALHQHYLRCARAAGAHVVCNFDVNRLELTQQHWEVGSAAGTLRAPVVVNAAGAWADMLGARAGARSLGLQPKRRSAFTFAPPAGLDTRAWPCVVGIDEDFYFKPDAGVLLGSPANADAAPPHDVVAEEIDIATGIARIEAATTMTIRRPLRTWAGLRSFVPDGALVGGFDDALPGFFWCCGQGGYGIQTSAAMGAACAARILGRALPSFIADEGIGFDDLRCRRACDQRT